MVKKLNPNKKSNFILYTFKSLQEGWVPFLHFYGSTWNQIHKQYPNSSQYTIIEVK